MTKKTLKFIVRRLNVKESVDVSRADMMRLVDNNSIMLSEPLQVYLLEYIENNKTQIQDQVQINLDLLKEKLSSNTISNNEITYILELLVNVSKTIQ